MSRPFCKDCTHLFRYGDGVAGSTCMREVGEPDLVTGRRVEAGWAPSQRKWSLFRDTCGPDAKYFEAFAGATS